MAADMKEKIAKAVGSLLMEKHVKNLTVKDIAEECHITRQTFYYHFEDIPDLFDWIIKKKTEELIDDVRKQSDPEEGFRYIILFAANAVSTIKIGEKTNYGKELESLLNRQLYVLFERISEISGGDSHYIVSERKIHIRYHVNAIRGFLRDWSEEDTLHAEEIIHEMYEILTRSEGMPR